MQEITVIPNADLIPPLKGIPKSKVYDIKDGIKIARLMGGVDSGRSSVGIITELPDGKHVLLQITMRNFLMVAEIFKKLDEQSNS